MRKAIIIGATSGIGLETARLLRQRGWTVGLAGRRSEILHSLRKEWGQDTTYTQTLDIRQAAAPAALRALIDEMGGVDIILLAAGIGWQNPDLTKDVELPTLETNVMGFTRMITAAYSYFASAGGGHIAAISSVAGTKGLGAAPAYSASKRFQNTYIQCLAQQAHANGLHITFTDIRPGFVRTALLSGRRYPMLMRPERVARQIVRALERRRRTVVVDWRYAWIVRVWRLIPDWLWERLG